MHAARGEDIVQQGVSEEQEGNIETIKGLFHTTRGVLASSFCCTGTSGVQQMYGMRSLIIYRF